MDAVTQETGWKAQRDKNFKWNFFFHCSEGGIFDGALHLVDYLVVLPPLILMLGGDAYSGLAGMMPAMIPIGFYLPGIFVSHLIERMPRFKKLNMITGIISRLIFLFAGLALIFLHESHPTFLIYFIAFSPLLLGFPLGISSPGWMTMISRMIPPNRLISGFAIRLFLGALLGFPAAWVVKLVLERDSSPRGFGILFLMAFGVLMVSYAFFAMIREVPGPQPKAVTTFWQNIRTIPGLIRKDAQLRNFLIAILLGGGIFLPFPWLGIRVLDIQDIPTEFGKAGMAVLGILVMWKMGGHLLGNMLGAFLGDLRGSKIVLLISRAVEITMCIWLITNPASVGAYYIIFILCGIIEVSMRVGKMTMAIEISPEEKRPTYTGLVYLVAIFTIMLHGGVGAYIWETSEHNIVWTAVPALILLLISTFFLLRIREPRKQDS